MFTQEEHMDVLAMRRQGWSITEIATELGYHPATVSKWLKNGGPPPTRSVSPSERAVDERWGKRIECLIEPPSRLLATSVYEILTAEGFSGSYPSVARYVRGLRGPRFRAAPQVSMPIETAPGEESQFDFSDCSERGRTFGLGEVLWCFGAVACWSRFLSWWFTTSVDREHTFEGLVRHFEDLGGVTKVARTDRMGALGHSQGRRFALHPPTVAFARHHGCEIKACQARDAKRKGKIERPFRGLEASFLEELAVLGAPSSIVELNEMARTWLAQRVNSRVHSVTKAVPAERLEIERRFLSPLATRRFDTAYRASRRVHVALPLIEWGAIRYSVPPATLGQLVECRVEVDSGTLQVRWGDQVVATHALASPGASDVWDPAHRREAEAAALGRTQGPLRLVAGGAAPRPAQPLGEYDIEAPDLGARYGGE
ncbi:MAG: IS21 family transposase [Acidimicrobiales bacterium]